MKGFGMEEWVGTGSEEKEKKMQELLAGLPEGFGFEGLRTFERWGRVLETGVFVYGGREFVFVPGDVAQLGWEGGDKKLDPRLRAELLEGLEEYEIEDVEAFLENVTSPARKVAVGPLLVEADKHEAGGEKEGIQAFRFAEEEFEDWMRKWATDGFRLPTENEWEYLHRCGGTTFFPWGDVFDYTMKLQYFEESAESFAKPGESSEERARRPYDLKRRNGFGLFFPGDPYTYELTLDGSKLRGKGGDGGSLICGGEGPLLGYLPATMTAYRNMEKEDEDKSERWKSLAPYSVYRRVLEISEEKEETI